MERRSKRLAKLQRDKPISYRETRVKRIFKKIYRKCTSVKEKQECQTQTESCQQRNASAKSSDMEDQPCCSKNLPVQPHVIVTHTAGSQSTGVFSAPPAFVKKPPRPGPAFGSRWPHSVNFCPVSQPGPAFANQRPRSAYFWPVFHSEVLQPKCKSSPGIFEDPLMTSNAVSKITNGKVGTFSAMLVLVKMPPGPVKHPRFMTERFSIWLQRFMVLVFFFGCLKFFCSPSNVLYTSLRDKNEALQFLEKEIIAVRHQLAMQQSLIDAVMELNEEGKNFYMETVSSGEAKRYIPRKDFALKSAGASVINSSQSYSTGEQVCTQHSCWECSQSPDVILERDNSPGNCWAMNGSEGYVVLKLSQEIYPTYVTLDFFSRESPDIEKIISAPKDFSVYGLKSDAEGTFLGKFSYRNYDFRTQSFGLPVTKSENFKYLQINILSNWGHPNYTCIYGIRVNGEE